MGYCRDVMGYCRDVMGQLKKSREKIQNRGAILNFFEFVRTGAPYAQQGRGPKSKTGSAGGTLFWTWAWTLFWSWALEGGCPPWALILKGVIFFYIFLG